jgi:hypothetical protein
MLIKLTEDKNADPDWNTFYSSRQDYYEYNRYLKHYSLYSIGIYNRLEEFNIDPSNEILYTMYLVGDDFNTTGYFATLIT